jgi:hypothetical protein
MASPATRKALRPCSHSRGAWTWSRGGRDIASIGYAWSAASQRLTLRYNCDGAPMEQTITVLSTAPPFGGARNWFRCPFTSKAVRALYLPPGARLWGSRHAYSLRYQSQREGGKDRALFRMLSRHGSWPEDEPLRLALLDRDPFGFRKEAGVQRRGDARIRRNEIRRIARSHKRLQLG